MNNKVNANQWHALHVRTRLQNAKKRPRSINNSQRNEWNAWARQKKNAGHTKHINKKA